MGKDKLFWKRKIRKAESLRRDVEKRDSYDVVLIVCEGSKTEPRYLRSLIKDFGLTNANIEVTDAHLGTDSLSVVKSAIHRYKRSPIYDKVYCVFDRDSHATFDQALQFIATSPLGNDAELGACVSVPCFEFWILLHYEYTTRQFVKAGTKSKCDGVVDRITKTGFGAYKKGMDNVYEKTKHLLNDAVKNAKLVRKFHDNDHEHPSTQICELVGYLQKLKKKKI